jgi:hypothetical protein
MGLSLPSDIVLDVMRNADPVRLSSATSKLQAIGAEGSSSDFAGVLSTAEGQAPLSLPVGDAAPARSASGAAAQHVEFERMVLRNLLESLLPDAASGVFGTGPSAGVWRSLAADQLAGLYAESGGIGIARTLSVETVSSPEVKDLQWPYFSSERIEAFSG